MSPALRPEWIAPARTALLIIDMQVDFALPEGAAGQGGADLSRVPDALANARELAAAARAVGAPVVFVGLQTRPATNSSAWRTWMERCGREPEREFDLCRAGSPGELFCGAHPSSGDLIVRKRGYTGFFQTNLDAQLRGLGRDTLIVCGLTTECCVDQTVRDAFHLDYQVFLAGDACAAYHPAFHEHTLRALGANYCFVVHTPVILDAWVRSL